MEISEINYELKKYPDEFSNFKFKERKRKKKIIKSILFNKGGYEKFAKTELSMKIKSINESQKVKLKLR